MSTVRTKHNQENPFVMINKNGLNDPNLSWAAKGLWAFLLSKPDDWKINISHLSKIYDGKGGGEKAIYSLLNELIREGYCKREQNHADNGKFDTTDYTIFEFKECLPLPPQRDALERDAVKVSLTNTDSNKKEKKDTLSSEVASAPSVASADAERLEKILYQKLIEINPKRKALTEKEHAKWAKTIDHMLKRDKRELKDIEAIIEWFSHDPFWSKTLQSAESLRRNFDQIYIRVQLNSSDEQKNRTYIQEVMKANPRQNIIQSTMKYVKILPNNTEIYYANHTVESFKELFHRVMSPYVEN